MPKKVSERKIFERFILTFISVIFVSVGIVFIIIGSYYNQYFFLKGIGSTATGAGLIGIVYDLILRKSSREDLRRELESTINSFQHVNRLNETAKERILLDLFNTYVPPEVADGIWNGVVKDILKTNGKKLRENFVHETKVEKINEEYQKIVTKIDYKIINYETDSISPFYQFPRFAVGTPPNLKNKIGKCTYIYRAYRTSNQLKELYKKYQVDINTVQQKLKEGSKLMPEEIESIRNIFDIYVRIREHEFFIGRGINLSKINDSLIEYEIDETYMKDIMIKPGKSANFHLKAEVMTSTLVWVHWVDMMFPTKDVKIVMDYLDPRKIEKRKIIAYPFFNSAPAIPSEQKTLPYIVSNVNHAEVVVDGWVLPLSGVVFVTFPTYLKSILEKYSKMSMEKKRRLK